MKQERAVREVTLYATTLRFITFVRLSLAWPAFEREAKGDFGARKVRWAHGLEPKLLSRLTFRLRPATQARLISTF